MLISLEAAVEGAAGLSEGGRGPKVEPGVPASPGLATVPGCKDLFRSAALGYISVPGKLKEI